MADKEERREPEPRRNDPATIPATLRDVELGLRFGHRMEAQGRIEQSQVAVEMSALIDLLIAKGFVSARELDERKEIARAQQDAREAERLFHTLSQETAEKRALTSPSIPCLELLPTCRGACCSLTFSLSIEDLEEGTVRWELGRPYAIRSVPETGLCFHFDPTGGCTIHADRPAICRRYDCRTDTRIWKDFDQRIPTDYVDRLPPIAAPAAPPTTPSDAS